MTARRPTTPPPPLWTTEDVRAHLGCSVHFVQTHKAELGARKVGRLLRFDPAVVLAFGTIMDDEPVPDLAPQPDLKLLPFDVSNLPKRNPLDGSRWPWDQERTR